MSLDLNLNHSVMLCEGNREPACDDGVGDGGFVFVLLELGL